MRWQHYHKSKLSNPKCRLLLKLRHSLARFSFKPNHTIDNKSVKEQVWTFAVVLWQVEGRNIDAHTYITTYCRLHTMHIMILQISACSAFMSHLVLLYAHASAAGLTETHNGGSPKLKMAPGPPTRGGRGEVAAAVAAGENVDRSRSWRSTRTR